MINSFAATFVTRIPGLRAVRIQAKLEPWRKIEQTAGPWLHAITYNLSIVYVNTENLKCATCKNPNFIMMRMFTCSVLMLVASRRSPVLARIQETEHITQLVKKNGLETCKILRHLVNILVVIDNLRGMHACIQYVMSSGRCLGEHSFLSRTQHTPFKVCASVI